MNPHTGPIHARLSARRTSTGGHPHWCAANHTCSAYSMTEGTHRSHPVAWTTRHGKFIATRVQYRDGHHRLELRLLIDLPARTDVAQTQAIHVAQLVQQAVATAATTPSPRLT